MSDLERFELILRRIHAKRQRAFEAGAVLDIDTQELLRDIADEIAASRQTVSKCPK